MNPVKLTSLDRWRANRLGLFIHWGIYAGLAGFWKGRETAALGENIMGKFQIPRREYERVARKFNPVKFNADDWVRMAKQAGFRYLVITAKHHDGFAMFRTATDPYNILHATPFGRDPMAELAVACKKHGLELGFYFSHCIDWHAHGGFGNTWDRNTGHGDPKAFAGFLEHKVKPQVRELLTQYGPICLLWFDTSAMISRDQALELKRYVKDLQPECLVSGRIYEADQAVGDYVSLGDNELPSKDIQSAGEGLITTNDTWGYKKNDQAWKSSDDLVRILSGMVSHDANLLINVGPTAEGLIPQPAVAALLRMGRWLRVNGAAIYGARGAPMTVPDAHPWYRITCKPDRLFVHLHRWPTSGFALHGLRNGVRTVRLMAGRNIAFKFSAEHDAAMDYHVLRIKLPEKPIGKPVFVLEIVTRGGVNVNPRAYLGSGFKPAKSRK